MLGKMEIRTPPGSRPRDGRHCDLCGCSQPAVRCDKCGCQIFCLSCDDMYHRHPKRRFHLRKAVDPIPPVPQARPVLPVKVAHLNAASPGDPSKMPLPPPRKKKSLFGSFRKQSPTSDNSPPLPKKEYSWTDRLGSIKKFMSNRPLPPLPNSEDMDDEPQPTTNGQSTRGDLSFIHRKSDERPPQLPQRSPRSPDFPANNLEKENRIPTSPGQMPNQIRNGSMEPNFNHMNQNREFQNNEENHWNNMMSNQNGPQRFGTLNRQGPQQRGFASPGMPGYPGSMHQSSSATDLQSLQNSEGMPGPGQVPPHFPHYPMNPHMPPHYPYPMYPQYPNYPQYFGNSFANLSNPPTSEGDFSDHSETAPRHPSKKHAFRKRAKRSQSVMMDRMAYPGQFYPFGPYPGYGPWGAPMPMEAPPSPASSVRSLNRSGRTRRRKKVTSEDDDEEFSVSSSPLSRPKSSSSDPKDTSRAPLATQTTSSEEESDGEMNKRRNKLSTIQRRQSEPLRSPSPAIESKGIARLKKTSSKQSDSDAQDVPEVQMERRPSRDSSSEQQPTPQQPSALSGQPDTWECRHCTYVNAAGNKICQVCCKTASPRTETPVTAQSRPTSAANGSRKQSVDSERGCSSPEKYHDVEEDTSKKERQDMASLNSALDEAEKQISKGLEELMKLKDDIDANMSKEKSKAAESPPQAESKETPKPVYKSSGRMRTSILDKLNLNKPQTSNASVSTSTDTQTGQSDWTSDKIIEARRHSNSSTTSENYNSPLAQSPDLDRGFLDSRQKRDSSCQTQQDSIAEYLEKKKAAEEAYLGRPVNNFGFGYGDRMDMVTSPVPPMYDRYFGGGYGMMQRSHSRASLFSGRVNDFGPMEYGGGFGYGPTQMYRSASRGSLTGDYPDGRLSEFHNLRKPDFYLSMEELVERRRQENIRAQGLELVRMIREAEQQGFNADDIQVALTHCGKQNPMEWLQENWRNMVDSVLTLSTNYGNDKKENDIGLLSEIEARDALRLHKGNIWAAVTECVEGRQRKYLEVSARGNFSRKDIVDALTSSEGDVEMAYAKLTKSTGKPFLMRIWGAGEGVPNQDGARPPAEDVDDLPQRYLKDDALNSDDLSEEIWSEDGDWEDDEEDFGDERGDIEDLQTCREDFQTGPQEMRTPESDRSDYCDAFPVDDRNASSPSDDIFFVIPEAKPEKKRGFLSKLAALRRDGKEQADAASNAKKEELAPEQSPQPKEDTISQISASSSEQTKNNGALNALKNTLSAIKDTVTGGTKNDKKLPSAQLERRTIIVRGQIDHESLSADSVDGVTLTSMKPLESDSLLTPDPGQKLAETDKEKSTSQTEPIKANEQLDVAASKEGIKSGGIETKLLKEDPKDRVQVTGSVLKPVETKVENKKPQSLAERLKFAKQYRSVTNVSASSSTTQKEVSVPAATVKDTVDTKINKEEISLNRENTVSKPAAESNLNKLNESIVSQILKDDHLPTEKKLEHTAPESSKSSIQQNLPKVQSEKLPSQLPDSTDVASLEKVSNESKLESKPGPSTREISSAKLPDSSKVSSVNETKLTSMQPEITSKKETVEKVSLANAALKTSSTDLPKAATSSSSTVVSANKLDQKSETTKTDSPDKFDPSGSSSKVAAETKTSSDSVVTKDAVKEDVPESHYALDIKESNSNKDKAAEVAVKASSGTKETKKESIKNHAEDIKAEKDIPNTPIELTTSNTGTPSNSNNLLETIVRDSSGSNSGNSANALVEEKLSSTEKMSRVTENQATIQNSEAIPDHSNSQSIAETSSSTKDGVTSSSKKNLTEETVKSGKQDDAATTSVKDVETPEKLQEGKLEQVPDSKLQVNLTGVQANTSPSVSVSQVVEQEAKIASTSAVQNIPENIVVESKENLDVHQELKTAAAEQKTACVETPEIQQNSQQESKIIASEEKTELEKSPISSTASETNEQKILPDTVQETTSSSSELGPVQKSTQDVEAKPLDEERKEVPKTEAGSESSQKDATTVLNQTEVAAASSETKSAPSTPSVTDDTKFGKFKFSKSGKVKKTQAKDDKKDSLIKDKDQTIAGTSRSYSLNKSSKVDSVNESKTELSVNDATTKAETSSAATSSKELIENKAPSEKEPKVVEADKSPKPGDKITETQSMTLSNVTNSTAQQEKNLLSPNKPSNIASTSGLSNETVENNTIPTVSQSSIPEKDLNVPSTSNVDLKTENIQAAKATGTEQKTTESTSISQILDNSSVKLPPQGVQLQEPVISKEFPGKKSTSINDVPSSSSASVSDSTNATVASSPTNETAVAKEEVEDSNSTAAPRQDNQHSKEQEAVIADTSTTRSDNTPSPAGSVFPSNSTSEIRTMNADTSTSQTVDSDDTDTQYSDDSRPSSVTPPSPVDALRSRFEGLAGATVRGQNRPQSPFRRMSLNSRKQVIALEKKRDVTDKPWYHQKIVTEPVRTTVPKRSIKQQLEMERRVRQMVSDRKCRTYRKAEIVVQLMDMNFEEDEAILAANECSTLEQAISYLQQECLLCTGNFPVSQIVSMTHCQHRACRECIRAYFTVQIRDRTILDLLCPFCNEPDIGDEDVAQDYFNHLDIMLKKLVDMEIHELFQRKLRDRVLMKDPNFRWCSQCSSGFIAMPNLKRLVCPDCNAVTCATCRRLWEREHQGISCEAFAAMKDSTDPESQALSLAKLLTEDGIDCPRCHFRYALAKGGCMHFRCIQCQHDFCSGCSRPFRMGQKCGVSEFCAKLGLHAHHPRNCLFYLRDKEPEDLQKLLEMNDISYNKDPSDGIDMTSTCQVMEQKETADGMVDDYCGKEVQEGYAGLCRIHYVEYLGQLVNKYKVDPIQIFENDDLELVLRRANIRLPPKRYRENDAQYREKLVNLIQEELPLDKMDGS